MKNLFKVLGMTALIAVFGFTFISCGDGGAVDGLTITGLSEYNTKYVFAWGSAGEPLGSDMQILMAARELNSSQEILVGEKVVNGSVTLKVYDTASGGIFTGSGVASLGIIVMNEQQATPGSVDLTDTIGSVSVIFDKGNAEGEFLPD
jgi:hypothetical protein